MTREDWLYILLGVAAGIYVWSRTQQGQETIAVAADNVGESVKTIQSAVRGIRNNNPGNIRKSSENWQGLSPDQSGDSSFFVFSSMDYGVRAMVKILRKYQQSYGLNTVRKIINRWAPPVENKTDAYVAFVAGQMGVGPDDTINVFDGNTAFSLVRAIIAQEVGRVPAMLISDQTVIAGINLAG